MHHPGHPASPWTVAELLVFFPLWWCFVTFLISRCGWTGFAETYAANEPPPAGTVVFSGCNGSLNWLSRYNRCLKVTPLSSGIHVVPQWLFRLFHPPLLLPWRAVQSVTGKRFLFIRRVVVRFDDREGHRLVLYLPSKAVAAIREACGRGDLELPPA